MWFLTFMEKFCQGKKSQNKNWSLDKCKPCRFTDLDMSSEISLGQNFSLKKNEVIYQEWYKKKYVCFAKH